MASPDLPPPLRAPQVARPVSAWLTPLMVPEPAFEGAVVIVVDAIRASTTIATALHHGALSIVPVPTVGDARLTAERLSGPEPVLLGGERAGLRIDGFDLGNSPGHYTPAAVAGRAIVFTTTNGTAALLLAAQAGAAHVLVGALANASAVSSAAAALGLPVHVLCAGTRDQVSADDCLAAGAIVQRLLQRGFEPSTGDGGDPARLCLSAWLQAQQDVPGAMRASRGGRNLLLAGLEGDIDPCAQVDSHPVVPRFDPRSGRIVAVDSAVSV